MVPPCYFALFFPTYNKTNAKRSRLPAFCLGMLVRKLPARSMVAVTLWLIGGLSMSAWLWGWCFSAGGGFRSARASVVFFHCYLHHIGLGDITLNPEWRILASFAAVNGLIVFGLNTAYLVEFTQRLRCAQDEHRTHRSITR